MHSPGMDLLLCLLLFVAGGFSIGRVAGTSPAGPRFFRPFPAPLFVSGRPFATICFVVQDTRSKVSTTVPGYQPAFEIKGCSFFEIVFYYGDACAITRGLDVFLAPFFPSAIAAAFTDVVRCAILAEVCIDVISIHADMVLSC